MGNIQEDLAGKGKTPICLPLLGLVSCSYDFGKTIGWEIKEGRNFSKDFKTDSSAVILNEAAVKYMNLKHPVGETMTWWGSAFKSNWCNKKYGDRISV